MLSALVLALTLASAARETVPLARVTGAMIEVTRGEATYRHEKGIAPDDAGAVYTHLSRHGESRPDIVRVPGRAGIFLASDFCGRTGEDLGRCLFLLENTRRGIRELSRSPSATGDDLRPVVFAGGRRTIVLAALGAEYITAVRVYEIAGTELRALGSIAAGLPGELGAEDPTPFAQVGLERGGVVVRFDADLVLGTGGEGAPVARKPVVFRQEDGEFVLVQAPARARPSR